MTAVSARTAGHRRPARAARRPDPARGADPPLRVGARARRPGPRHLRRRVPRAARPVGLRQDDGAAGDRRVRPPGRRPGAARRPGHHRRARQQARHGHGVPGLQPVPEPHRRRERGLRAAGAPPRRRPSSRGRARSCWSSSAWPTGATATRTSSPAASSSGWRSPARWRSRRRCCCSTSRCRRWTPRCGCSCARRSAASSSSSASPPSSSPTTRPRRCRSPTGSASSAPGRLEQVATPGRAVRAAGDRVRRRVRRHDEPGAGRPWPGARCSCWARAVRSPGAAPPTGPVVALVRPEALLVDRRPRRARAGWSPARSPAPRRGSLVALPDGVEVRVDLASADSGALLPRDGGHRAAGRAAGARRPRRAAGRRRAAPPGVASGAFWFTSCIGFLCRCRTGSPPSVCRQLRRSQVRHDPRPDRLQHRPTAPSKKRVPVRSAPTPSPPTMRSRCASATPPRPRRRPADVCAPRPDRPRCVIMRG